MKKFLYKWAMNYILKQHSLWRRTDGKKGRRFDVSNRDLPYAQFKHANLQKACFSDATLTECNFQRTWVHNSNFEDAILHYAIFNRADLSFAQFHQAILRKVDFNLRAVNRQAEELDRLKMRAKDLWRVVDDLNFRAKTADLELAKELRLDATDVEWFLKDCGILRKSCMPMPEAALSQKTNE